MRILTIADIHVGSRKGLNPRSAFDQYTNAFQEWALEMWEEDLIPKYKNPDYLILLGDTQDGAGSKDSTDLITSNVEKQIEWATELYEPLIGENTKVMGVGGSGYHRGTGTGFDGDYRITKNLHGQWKGERFSLILESVAEILYFAHASKTSLETELRILRENAWHNPNFLRPTRVIGGHLHRYDSRMDGSVHITHAPCFQYITKFMQGIARIPTIGALGFSFNGKNVWEKAEIPIIYSIPTDVFIDMENWTGETVERQQELDLIKNKRRIDFLEMALQKAKACDPQLKIEEEKPIEISELPEDIVGQGWKKAV